MEKTVRCAKEFEVPDSIYEEISITGRIPDDYFNKMSEILDDVESDTEYDYAVYDVETDKQLIEWG